MNDRVMVDGGERGTIIGFYARDHRTVLVRLDVAGVREVLECNVAPAPEGRKSPEQLYAELEHAWNWERRQWAHAPIVELTDLVELRASVLDLRDTGWSSETFGSNVGRSFRNGHRGRAEAAA